MAEDKTTLHEKLVAIQSELKVPKGQRNTFGNYNYRSIEDIQEAVKPLLKKYNCSLRFFDEIILTGERFYVKATAALFDGDHDGPAITSTAYAREAENKKGMDEAQLTGATSSYARKYAAGGLFLIDDTSDADATNDHSKTVKLPTQPQASVSSRQVSSDPPTQAVWDAVVGTDEPVTTAQVNQAFDNTGYAASEKQRDFIISLAKKAGKNSTWINETYGITWPDISSKLAKVVIEDLK